MSISAQPKYEKKSFEELRYEYLKISSNVQKPEKRPLPFEEANQIKKPKYLKDKKAIIDLCDVINESYRNLNENSDAESLNTCEANRLLRERKKLSKLRRTSSIIAPSSAKRSKLDCEGINENQKENIGYCNRSKTKRKFTDKNKEDNRLLDLINKKREEGNHFLKTKSYQLAYDCYSEALSINPKFEKLNSVVLSNRILALMKLKRFDDALFDCNQYLKITPNNIKVSLRKVMTLVELNRYDEAEGCAISIKNDLGTIECEELLNRIKKFQLIKKADNFSQNNDHLSALEYWNQILEIDPDNFSVRKKRFNDLFALEKYSEAIIESNILLKVLEDDSSTFDEELEYKRSICLMKLERFEEAIEYINNLKLRNPTDSNIQLSQDIEQQYAKSKNRNYYDWLNVAVYANSREIRKQYLKLTRLYHPDKLVDCSEQVRMKQEEKFKLLTEAYETLINPINRRKYNLKHGIKV